MEKTTKIILIAGSSILVASVGLAVYNHRRKRSLEGLPEESVIDDVVTTVTNVVSPCSKNATFPIKKGQKSKGVRDVQVFINRLGVLPEKIKEDCDFGTKTEAAAREVFRQLGQTYGDGISEQTYRDFILRGLNSGFQSSALDTFMKSFW